MAQNNTPWVTVGSIIAGFVMLGACCCGAAGYVGLMVAARVDQDKKLKQGKGQAEREYQLKEIGMAHLTFFDAHKRGANNVDELKPFLADSTAEARIRSGEITVVWDAPGHDDGELLLAWETVPDDRGLRATVYLDSRAVMMDEARFSTTPKARAKQR